MKDLQVYSREFGDPSMDDFWMPRKKTQIKKESSSNIQDYNDPFGCMGNNVKSRNSSLGDIAQLSMSLSHPILYTRTLLNNLGDFLIH